MTVATIAERLGGLGVLGQTVRTEADLITLVEQGLPKATIRYLAESLTIDVSELVHFLPVTARNLQRYQEVDRLSEVVSDHLIALAALFIHGEEALGKAYFRDWLYGSILTLGNRRPVDFLRSHLGIDIIDRELGRIEHGLSA